jgi:hypothetical protein
LEQFFGAVGNMDKCHRNRPKQNTGAQGSYPPTCQLNGCPTLTPQEGRGGCQNEVAVYFGKPSPFWLLAFVLVPQPVLTSSTLTQFLGLRETSFWVGTRGTRGQGPPAQWLPLLFDTPEGAWPLSPKAPAALFWLLSFVPAFTGAKRGELTEPPQK